MASVGYIRYRLVGTLTASQTWSIGVSLVTEESPSAAQLATWNAATHSAVSTWWNATGGPGGFNQAVVKLTAVYAGFYPAGSSVATVTSDVAITALSGAGETQCQPAQTALVVTLKTGLATRRGRGRFYLPATGVTVSSSTLLMTTPTTSNVAIAAADFLTSLAGVTLISEPTVLSIAVPGDFPPSPVQTVQVDSVLDTQRRRRDKITGTFTSEDFPVVG